jgi:hypothetical protein
MMIRNVSYNNKEIKKEIDDLVGKPYGMMERFRMGGIGSPKFTIREASEEIRKLLSLDSSINYCNIEIRPKGVIVGFRSILESYAWVIPFDQLSVFYQHKELSLFTIDNFIEIDDRNRSRALSFAKKLMVEKEKAASGFSLA